MDRGVFESPLRRRGDVPVMFGKLFVFFSCRSKLFHNPARKLIVLSEVMIENRNVESKSAVAIGRQHFLAKKIVELWLPVSGEAHDLPLVTSEHVKANIICNRGIELTET